MASWVPGIPKKLLSDVYRLYAKDDGQTGAEGLSEPFRIASVTLHSQINIEVTIKLFL